MDPTGPVAALSRWADVSAALAHPALVIAPGGPVESPPPFEQAQLRAWSGPMTASAKDLASSLPEGAPFDLMSDFAAPWSRSVAALVLHLDRAQLPAMLAQSEALFLAAAHAEGIETGSLVSGPAGELARLLPDQPLAVQAFVALAHTLPHALCSTWAVLLEYPGEQHRLAEDHRSVPAAAEELLRLAGPSRAVYRVALEDLTIGEIRIPRGTTVRLELAHANRDPARFHEPGRFLADRGEGLHLAFGRGRHACAGAQLIRQSVMIATEALLARGRLVAAGTPTWLEGAAIRAPAVLPVTLQAVKGESKPGPA